jgi:hypothetical protein
MTWDRQLYFPSEGRRADDFLALKNPTASAGFEHTNLGTKGQHATPRPPKPLSFSISCSVVFYYVLLYCLNFLIFFFLVGTEGVTVLELSYIPAYTTFR